MSARSVKAVSAAAIMWGAMTAAGGLGAARSATAAEAGKRVALLVGVDTYLKPGFRALRFAEADVQAVGAELRKLGFEATILLGSGQGDEQATRANIERTAAELARPLGYDDLMLVMLSGHGQQLLPDPGVDAGGDSFDKSQSYYCPVDAVANQPETQFSLSHLVDDILAPNVGRKLILVDACRDVPASASRGRGQKGIEGRVVALPEGTGIFFSCSAGQTSFERDELGHGVFTWCVLEGLRGKAVVEGELDWNYLVAYASRRMTHPEMTKYTHGQQVPIQAGAMPHTVLGKVSAAASTTPKPPPTPPRTPSTPAAPPVGSSSPPGRDLPRQVVSAVGLPLQLISAGEFRIGSPPTEDSREDHEGPQRLVKITRPFYLGVYEVTQADWRAVMGSNPSDFSAEGDHQALVAGRDTSRRPVENVSWYDSIEFCNRLSQRDRLPPYYQLTGARREVGSIKAAGVTILGGNGYRLPTEAEWEYACRAGTVTAFHFGPGNNGIQANVDGESPYDAGQPGPNLQQTVDVGRYPRNAFGLHDMHGNVWEWCADGYIADAYRTMRDGTRDPVVAGPGEPRVLRGGSWQVAAWNSRSANRWWMDAAVRSHSIGLRVARTP